MSGLSFRTAALVALGALMCWSGLAASTAAESGDPWPEIASNVFHGRQLADGSGVFALEMPARAEDAAIVPVTMRTTLPAGDARTLRAVTLIVDANPSPVAATFKVGSGVTMISTRVRVNSYTEVDSSIVFSHVNIGRHCRIKRAIIDRDVHIADGTVIGYDPVEDKRRYFVTPTGLTIVTRDASLFENPVDPDFLKRY